MNILEELSQKALQDEYFKELFYKAETSASYNFLQLKKDQLLEKEFIDILRFADILSRSSNSDAQNKAYKVISLLVDDYKNNDVFKIFANSILTKLGNFPAIELCNSGHHTFDNQPLELILEQYVKRIYQQAPGGKKVFTDAQYKIFESLKNSNHYSFSGPTSLGKSFILGEFIRNLIAIDKVGENIIILVPTRALINQITQKLKKEFSDIREYRVLSHPVVPETFKEENSRYIFVFTPERLIAYLSDNNNPKIGYLFIDEAQKIISEKDSRGPLYYHAILQAERKSIKLYFASPNIPNPEVFLELFEKSTDESVNIKSSPVAQNRYFLDLLENRFIFFSDVDDEQQLPLKSEGKSFEYWLKKLSDNQPSIVYCNTKSDTIQYSLDFARQLPEKKDKRIDEVISIIKGHLHERYFLIDCLKKGVAFHFGNLPQRIREKVERLFEDGAINYVFCTSTLLEGVNLPAKNIFILSNAIGLTRFSDIDFWNLAGRAGRLASELSGNIICVRVEKKKNRWERPEKDLIVVKNKEIKSITPLMKTGKKNFFKNIEASLTDSDFTRKDATANERSIWNHYANITLIHEIRSDASMLRANFIRRNETAQEILSKATKNNTVPEKILSAYSMIKAKYQNKVYNSDDLNHYTLSSDLGYNSVLENLKKLCKFYSWDVEESYGHKPMYISMDGLKYYAVLMSSWMESKPLSWMISDAIKYYTKKGEIWHINQRIIFQKNNQHHINLVINEVISDIDNILRFKLKNYFGNYYELLSHKLGTERAGENWGEFLEYGTNDFRVIELQNIGLPRHLANYLIENYLDVLTFDRNKLVAFNKNKLLKNMDKESIEFNELIEVI